MRVFVYMRGHPVVDIFGAIWFLGASTAKRYTNGNGRCKTDKNATPGYSNRVGGSKLKGGKKNRCVCALGARRESELLA